MKNMKNWTLYKPTQTEAEIILKLAESKGIKVYCLTRQRILDGHYAQRNIDNNDSLHFNGEEVISFSFILKAGLKLSFPEVIAEIHAFNSIPKVRLNDKLEAEITRDGIQVGCQTISFDAFNELKKAVKKFKS